MFSKVDHVLDTTSSYYIALGTSYIIREKKDVLFIDSGGSIYILAADTTST